MSWIMYFVLFIGCATITTTAHILMLNKLKNIRDSSISSPDKLYEDIDSCINKGIYTLLVLISLSILLTCAIGLGYINF